MTHPQASHVSPALDDTELPASSAPGTGRAAPKPGDRLLRYEVIEVLGQGGMGLVVAAHDPDLDRRIAIKVLRTDVYERGQSGSARLRLLREARAMAKLTHPNVVSVYDVGTVDGNVFIAMEYADGGTIRDWLNARPRDPEEIIATFAEAGRGLSAAHRAGLVHRDFKPANVVVHSDGRVQVTDFGLVGADRQQLPESELADDAASLSAALTRAGAVMGTPWYMAPEQFKGETVDAAADQFSFCVALFEALFQQRPFAGDDFEELQSSVLAGDLSTTDSDNIVPARIRAAIRRGLSVAPDQRHASMDVLLEKLSPEARVSTRRPTAALAVVVVAIIAMAVGAFLFVTSSRQTFEDNSTRAVVVQPAPPPATTTSRPLGVVQMTFAGNAKIAEISPRGTYLAYVKGTELRLRNLKDRSDRRVFLSRRTPLLDVRWNTDETQLYFSVNMPTDELYRYELKSTKVENLGRRAVTVCATPGGSMAKVGHSASAIFIRDLDDKNGRIIPVTSGSGRIAQVSCSVVAGRFLVQVAKKSGASLVTVKFDGSDPKELMKDARIGSARWAPNGKAVHYLRKHKTQPHLELVEHAWDASSKKLTRARVLVSRIPADSRSFSAAKNGTVAFVQSAGGSNLWSVQRNKNGRATTKQLTFGTALKSGPRISPDGRLVGYGLQQSKGFRVMVAPVGDLSKAKPLARTSALPRGIAWSPDSKTLVYVGVGANDKADLYAVGLDGVAAVRLHKPDVSKSQQIAWAPRKRVLYHTARNQNFNLTAPTKGAAVEPLLKDPHGWPFLPVWSPDGKRLAVWWNRNRRGLWSVDLSTRKSTLVAEGMHSPIGWSADQRWIYTLSASRIKTSMYQIARINVSTGRIDPWLELPATMAQLRAAAPVNNGKSFIANVVDAKTDIWLGTPQ